MLFITSIVVFMVSLEITIIALAFPQIEAAFPNTPPATLSWVITAYNIGVASLLLLSGWWADSRGRKRVFLIGIVLFAAGSVLAGLAWSAPVLIGARVVQSIGGAIQYPAGLALLLTAFPAERRQGAIGVWGAMGALAAAVGPSLGGFLVDLLGWRSTFLINVPVAVVAAALGRRWLVESSGDVPAKVDTIGVPLAAIGVGSILFGIVQVESAGVGAGLIVPVVIGVALIGAFVQRSRTHPTPLFDLRLFDIATYRWANVAQVAFLMAFFSWLVTLPSFLQDVWDWSVLRTGLAIAPSPLVAMVLSPFSGRLADRVGVTPLLLFGSITGVAGSMLHWLFTDETPNFVLGVLLPGVLIGLAAGGNFAMLVAAAMRDIPPTRFGMAGAGRTTVFQLAVACGVAMGFAITAGATGDIDWASRMRALWVVGAVLYAAEGLIVAVRYPRG